ncbi:MAG: tRNA epoxyqueuosine(34) reductase QueG [Puniceicoccales bacterium]|jgi:epoxyqueuosine reductase|nr:tRNA epoxyqueuosine(34) reductase QueG [Puniceicoccales bacterium]
MAASLGFQAFGVAAVAPPLHGKYYLEWIAGERHGTMRWMERNNERRLAPDTFLPGVRSIVMLGMNCFQAYPDSAYKIARYALGSDYHNYLFKRLKKLCAVMRDLGGEQRPCVDTAPVLEKPAAVQAGLGWQGKSTLLVNREFGTWLLLGAIFTTLELEADVPERDNCGHCTRCLAACPTGAITGPYQLDARRCLAYLSIEHDGPIPVEFRGAMGDHLFGCDVCQDACPWSRRAQVSQEEKQRPLPLPERLRDTFAWTEAEYDLRFSGTPLKRLGLRRWWRNACVVLGNTGGMDDVPVLERLASGADALLAEHAAWALERIAEKG